ncbi:MAG: Ig-like domain-containing protein [Muribaculaceae bacterium]|nr:Ig-like domain-containing protein [Muribaculaceae bacterium]
MKKLLPKTVAWLAALLVVILAGPGRASAAQTISGTWQVSQLTDDYILLSGATTLIVDCDKKLKRIIKDTPDAVTLDIVFQSASYTLTVEWSGRADAITVSKLNVMGPGNLIATSRCCAISCSTANFTNVYVKAKGRNDVGSETDETNSVGISVWNLNINNSEVYATGRRFGICLMDTLTITGDASKVTAEGRGHHKTVWGGDSSTGDEDCWGRGIGNDSYDSYYDKNTAPMFGTIVMEGGQLDVQSDVRCGIWCERLEISGGTVNVNSNLYGKQKDEAAIICCSMNMTGGTLNATSNKHGIETFSNRIASTVSGGHLSATGGTYSYGIYLTSPGKGFYISGENTQVDANGSNGGIYSGSGNIYIDRVGLNAKARADGYYAVRAPQIHITLGDKPITGITSNKEPFYAGGSIYMYRPFAVNGKNQENFYPIISEEGTKIGNYFSLNGSVAKKQVELTKPSLNHLCGTVNYTISGIGNKYYVGDIIKVTVPQSIPDLLNYSNPVRTVKWFRTETEGGSGIHVGTGDTYVAQPEDAGKYIHANVSYDTHDGFLSTQYALIVKEANNGTPVKPTLTYSAGLDKIAVTNTRADQEYLVLSTETSTITEEQWASAEAGGSNSYMLLDGGTKGQLNYVYTRLRETGTTEPGSRVLYTSVYYGSAIGMTDFTLTATTADGAALPLDANRAYNVAYNSVVKLTLAPVPNSVSWPGVSGDLWWINGDTSGGTLYGSDMGYLYSDAACTTPIVVDGEHFYTTVYYKCVNNSHNGLTGMMIEAVTTVAGRTVAHYVTFNVSNGLGTWDVMNIAPSLFRVEQGSVVTLPYTVTPEAATCNTLTAVAQGNSWGGTAPTLTFDPSAMTVTIDATNSEANSNYFYYNLKADGRQLSLRKGVEVLPASLQSVVVSPHEALLDPGATLQLTATVLPATAAADNPVAWDTDNHDFATIDEDGLLHVSESLDCLGEEVNVIVTCGEFADTCHVSITGEKYPLWVKGIQVNSVNQGDVLGDGKVSYEAGKLTLNAASINTNNTTLALKSEVPGLIIDVKGTNALASVSDAVTFYEPTRLTGNGEFRATTTGSGSGTTVAFGAVKDVVVEDTVHVQAANNGSSGTGSWVMGNLSVEGPSAQFRAYGKMFSILLGSLSGIITEPEGGYLQLYEGLETSTVYDTAGRYVRSAWVTIVGEADEPEPLQGDVNGDGVVSGADVTALYNVLLDDATVAGNADVNGDGVVSGADVTALYNILLEQ